MILRLEVNGLKTGIKPILWSLMALAMSLFIVVPGLNVLALLFSLVPYTLLYTQLDKKSFVVHVLVILVVGSVIIDPFIFLSTSILALIPSIYMGHLYRAGTPSLTIIPKMTGIMLVLLMLELLVIENVIGISMLSDIRTTLIASMNNATMQALLPLNWNAEVSEGFVKMFLDMIPFVILLISFGIVICSHYVARKLATIEGIVVPAFPAAKDWRLPRSILFLYLLVYIIQMMVNPLDTSFLTVALASLVPTLSFLFSIQAVGFFFYLAHNRNWPKIIPVLIAIPVILIPFFSILGILDAAFPLRKYISKQT